MTDGLWGLRTLIPVMVSKGEEMWQKMLLVCLVKWRFDYYNLLCIGIHFEITYKLNPMQNLAVCPIVREFSMRGSLLWNSVPFPWLEKA